MQHYKPAAWLATFPASNGDDDGEESDESRGHHRSPLLLHQGNNVEIDDSSSDDEEGHGVSVDLFESTFYEMQSRRVEREGRTDSPVKGNFVHTVSIVFLCVVLFQELAEYEWFTGEVFKKALFILNLTIAIIATIWQVVYFMIRVYKSWFETFFLDGSTFILTIYMLAHVWDGARRVGELVVYLCVGFAFIWLSLFVLFRRIKPMLMMRACVREHGAKLWFSLKQVQKVQDLEAFPGIASIKCSYRPQGWFSLWRHHVGYVGSVDSAGRPHGHGRWFDTAFHGEILEGVWEHGQLGSVFEGIVRGIGAQTRQGGVGYATSRADCPPGKLNKKERDPATTGQLRFGAALCEVSLAGGLYSFLPRLTYETQCSSVDALVHWMRTLPFVDGERQFGALGCFFSDTGVQEEDSAVGRDEMSLSTLPSEKEALVFIHGFNYSIATGCKKVVQLTMLGGLGTHVIPFLFSWSSGTVSSAISQLGDVKVSAGAYGENLAEFLRELGRHFKRIHILTHSMGALVLFHNFKHISPCFKRRRSGSGKDGQRDAGSSHLPELSTVTIMNPDVLMEDVNSVLPDLLSYAERFTAYNDRHDRVLMMDWIYQKVLPRSLQGWRAAAASDDEEDPACVMLGADASPLWLEATEDGDRCVLRKGVAVANHTPSLLRRRIEGSARSQYRWDGVAATAMQKNPEGFSRIDIVDTTTIDTHVGLDRHNYFGLNPLVVQDVCELISNRWPASRRVRLTRTYCNVFRFRTLPFNAG